MWPMTPFLHLLARAPGRGVGGAPPAGDDAAGPLRPPLRPYLTGAAVPERPPAVVRLPHPPAGPRRPVPDRSLILPAPAVRDRPPGRRLPHDRRLRLRRARPRRAARRRGAPQRDRVPRRLSGGPADRPPDGQVRRAGRRRVLRRQRLHARAQETRFKTKPRVARPRWTTKRHFEPSSTAGTAARTSGRCRSRRGSSSRAAVRRGGGASGSCPSRSARARRPRSASGGPGRA